MTDEAEATMRKTAEQAQKAYEMSMEMGRAFMDAWTRNLSQMQGQTPSPAPTNGQVPLPFQQATQVWMEAVTEATRRTQEAFTKGETLTPDAYADIWSEAAAKLAQEVVKDAAFAQVTGQWVNAAATAKGQARQTAEERIRDLGFSTHGDVDEVAKRLVELERRVHDLQVLLEDKVVPALDTTKPARAPARKTPAKKSAAKKASTKKTTKRARK